MTRACLQAGHTLDSQTHRRRSLRRSLSRLFSLVDGQPRCHRNDSGFQLRGDALRVAPCVPPNWPGFELSYCHQSARYRIVVDNSADTGRGVRWIELDGQRLPSDTLPLSDDVNTHNVRVQLG
jgi:hypothetical protein